MRARRGDRRNLSRTNEGRARSRGRRCARRGSPEETPCAIARGSNRRACVDGCTDAVARILASRCEASSGSGGGRGCGRLAWCTFSSTRPRGEVEYVSPRASPLGEPVCGSQGWRARPSGRETPELQLRNYRGGTNGITTSSTRSHPLWTSTGGPSVGSEGDARSISAPSSRAGHGTPCRARGSRGSPRGRSTPFAPLRGSARSPRDPGRTAFRWRGLHQGRARVHPCA